MSCYVQLYLGGKSETPVREDDLQEIFCVKCSEDRYDWSDLFMEHGGPEGYFALTREAIDEIEAEFTSEPNLQQIDPIVREYFLDAIQQAKRHLESAQDNAVYYWMG